MSYRDGEVSWYDAFTPDQKRREHAKPWTYGAGAMLAEAGALISLLPPPPLEVLDAGCAGGHLSHILSLMGYTVTGADICKNVLDEAAKLPVRWNHLESSAAFQALDFDHLPEETWDAIIFASALHHSIDRLATLRSCFKALRPGGILMASEPGVGHGESKISVEWSKKMDVTEKSTPPYSIARDGKKAGFRNIKVYPNPVTLHKAAYETDALGHHPAVKFMAGLPMGIAAVTAAKWLHGLTVMWKPGAGNSATTKTKWAAGHKPANQ